MTDKELHYRLIEYLALTASHFNSGFSDTITYTDDHRRERSTLMHNWFLPPKAQFPDGYKTGIGMWFLKEATLKDCGAELTEFGRRPREFDRPVIFLPQTLAEDWSFLQKHFGPPDRVFTGYMTPSGRSFWVLGENNTAFGLKFHVPNDADTSVILNRGLDPEMIRNTVICSDELGRYPEAMDESYGASLQFGPDAPQKFAFLWRNFKWDLLRPEPGQVIVSMPVLLSQSLWTADEVLAHLGFPLPAETDMREWFTEELAPHMAELISTSLFKTGLHPEVHQQNLSVILQNGHFKHMIYHDLQDCLHDPVTRFLLLNPSSSADGPDLSAFRTRHMLALPGEILTPDNKDKLFITLTDWWRRWLRVFGRYDRILNVLWGHDPFRETVFEDAVCAQLHLAAEHAGLTLTAESKSYGLFTFMAWAQYEFQQKLLPQFFSGYRTSLTAATESDLNLFTGGICLASSRAPWSQSLLTRWLHENRGTAWKIPCREGRFVFLKSDTGCHLYFYRDRDVHLKSHAPL